ncbi:MAG: magnesium transporter [Rhodopseudomonas palustris]|nr:magnesium transporter [Rhodopseudomonas palustris]
MDAEGRLLGRITVDDVVDVIRDEAEHSGDEHGRPRRGRRHVRAASCRAPAGAASWLGINLGTAFLAAWVVGLFEATIQHIVALAVLMPIVASMGGVAATQTLTLIVRGLALGQVERANARWLLTKEIAVALLNGVAWATVVALVALPLVHAAGKSPRVIFAAMIVNLFAAALAGVIGAARAASGFGVDPAVAGGVVVTTVTDVVGFASLLGLGHPGADVAQGRR